MKKKILILSANPKDTDQLRLDQEAREISEGLKRAQKRDSFEIISCWATRPADLQRALIEYRPELVHFSGHGTGEQGLVLENDQGTMQLVSTEALSELFELFKATVECVVLNACYSEAQASAICEHIDYVLGMNDAVGDKTAIKFATGFYDALGGGFPIEQAYKLGRNRVKLEGLSGAQVPVIKMRQQAGRGGEPAAETTTTVEAKSIGPPSVTPVDQLERPEGRVSLSSPFYIERPPIEADCYDEISRPGALIRIKAPRQMGKSSLMLRIQDFAAQQGARDVSINCQEIDAEFLENLDPFLQWFCYAIADKLGIPDNLEAHWKGVLGSKNKCTNYFQRYLLPELKQPLVLGLDEVDELFKHDKVVEGFFGLLRAWHEKAKNESVWHQFRLVIAHSKEVYVPLNIYQSPFNVGLPIELPELTQTQVTELVQRHGLAWSEEDVAALMAMVDGHPYLVREALYQIARQRMTLAELIQVAPTEEGPYGEHLRRHLLNVQEDESLSQALRQVIGTPGPIKIDSTEAFKLRSLGLIRLQGNMVTPLCDLYRLYFQDRLEG